MERKINGKRKPTDRIADVLSEAGMEPRHKTYQKKYKQMVRLELSERECDLLLSLCMPREQSLPSLAPT